MCEFLWESDKFCSAELNMNCSTLEIVRVPFSSSVATTFPLSIYYTTITMSSDALSPWIHNVNYLSPPLILSPLPSLPKNINKQSTKCNIMHDDSGPKWTTDQHYDNTEARLYSIQEGNKAVYMRVQVQLNAIRQYHSHQISLAIQDRIISGDPRHRHLRWFEAWSPAIQSTFAGHTWLISGCNHCMQYTALLLYSVERDIIYNGRKWISW